MVKALLGVFMFGGRTQCWLKRRHHYVETLVGYEPSIGLAGHIWMTYHVNCLRCPSAFTTSRKVPYLSRDARRAA